MKDRSPAIFLDRDGVIIENRSDYVLSWDDVHFYPQALTALEMVKHSPYKIIIVTNQSAVAKGLISIEAGFEINRRIHDEITRNGGRIDGIYMCPHQAEDGCDCRKPKPGLIYQASGDLDIDLHHSIMIGDALSDIQAGMAAGINKNILLLTGRGQQQSKLPGAAFLQPFTVHQNLQEAINSLLFSG